MTTTRNHRSLSLFVSLQRRLLMLSILMPQLLLAGAGCVADKDDGDKQGTATDTETPPAPQVASEWSAAVTGVKLWRTSGSEDSRLRFVGVDGAGGEVLSGTATAEPGNGDDDEQWWTFALDKPYAATTRYLESEVQPQPSGDAHADVLFEAVTRDVFLGETTLQPSESSVAVSSDLGPVPHLPAGRPLHEARDGLQCINRYMLASYAKSPEATICGLKLEKDFSNEYVLLYSGLDPDDAKHPYATRRLVVAFAGSHRASDWIRNLQSQFMTSVQHKNPLDGSTAIGGGRVGRGWVQRWLSQANL
jgi:hypothetical protein